MFPDIKIAGLVVLYNPEDIVVSNISSCAEQVEIIFVIDNSPVPNIEIVKRINKIKALTYISNGKNEGLAKALNMGAIKAIEHGYNFLLTMDQDSKPYPDMVERMLSCFSTHDPSTVGIVSPFHMLRNTPHKIKYGYREVLVTMTSGNLLNLEIYRTVGPFMDELFIDYIDHEYCLRLQMNGFKVIEVADALLEHNLGNIETFDFIVHTFATTNHSPFRRYFMTRNRFYLMNKYKLEFRAYCRHQLIEFFYELAHVFFFERQKIMKFRMVLKGYLDYKKNAMGKVVSF